MKKTWRRKRGAALTEYIIIVVIVAIAAIAIVGVFSDRVRELFGGAAVELGADQSEVDSAISTKSADKIKEIDVGNN